MNSQLDPRTANADWCYGELLPGYDCVGRLYYWYDPARKLPAVDNYDFAEQHPEIANDEWWRLLDAALARSRRCGDPTLTLGSHWEPPGNRDAELLARAPKGRYVQEILLGRASAKRWRSALKCSGGSGGEP